MDTSTTADVISRLKSALVLGIFALLISYIAYLRSFFRLRLAPTAHLITIRLPLLGFVIALLIFLFSGVVAFALLGYFFPGVKELILQAPLIAITTAQAFTICTMTVFLLLFAFLQPKGVVRAIACGIEDQTKRSWISDVGIGVVTWIISFPVIGFIYELVDLATYFFFGTVNTVQPIVLLLREFISSPYLLTIILFSVIIVAPITEEIIFRGILQTYLKRKVSFKWALCLPAFIFTLLHLSPQQGWGNLPLACAMFTFALYLGFIYEKYRSLYAPIALHMTFNSVNVMRILLS